MLVACAPEATVEGVPNAGKCRVFNRDETGKFSAEKDPRELYAFADTKPDDYLGTEGDSWPNFPLLHSS